ncbi:glycosyltransferase [Bosea sp. NBC_00550]|uniref:glycosyltransferase n=1 Tax=Bosea sp. NBC_00550 TaxID=2969621 RepID=UPI0022328390|nr:glycosyltransferase [Bosea sp. NBC_00550]UZF91305.1 glycosyltransferase [Bosea sp. NBC_00550]
MNAQRYPLVIVTPVYEDTASATILFRNLKEHCPVEPYVIAVEDGSVRNPLAISAIADAGLSGEIIYLARNMGHQRAIATGLSYVAANLDADAVVVLDCDGEDMPEAIPPLLEELQTKDVDAVVAQRRKRSETLGFRTFYVIYRHLFGFLTGRTIRFGNFTALNMFAVKRLAAMQELWVHFAASLMVSRLRIGAVATDRGKRYAGKSKMNFVSLALHGLRSMMVFAEDVLVRVGLFCALLASVSLGLLGLSVVLKLVGFATPGWFSVAAGLLILILMQAGVLTFVTLMISGLIKSAPPITRAQLEMLIRHVERTDTAVRASG